MARFEKRDGSICFCDSREHSNVTLHVDGEPLIPRGCFKVGDEYEWRFEFFAELYPGQIFVFHSDDFEFTGTADQNTISEWPRPSVPRSPLITILLVTLDRLAMLERTLWHLYETTSDAERDLFIWDNGSSDDTKSFLGTMVGWPGVRVFRSESNLGVYPPRMRMLRAVNTPFIYTLDDDVWMLTRGWATAAARVLERDQSIHQLQLFPSWIHCMNWYGIHHSNMSRPFFRVPMAPIGDRYDRLRPAESNMAAHPDVAVAAVEGERVAVPRQGSFLPFSCSGSSSAWRLNDVLSLCGEEPSNHHVDFRESWGTQLARRGSREGNLFGYSAHHPSPGALWHLGEHEPYWQNRVREAPRNYGRSESEQARWLTSAREAWGWGRPLEDADEVLPP